MSVRNIIIAVCFFILILFHVSAFKAKLEHANFSGVKDHVSIGIINNDTSDYSKC